MPQDIVAPTLVSIALSDTLLDIENGETTVTVTARFTDDVSGVASSQHPYIYFQGPIGHTVVGVFARVSGDAFDGVYTVTLSINPFAESGTWSVGRVYTWDEATNSTSFGVEDASQLRGLNFGVRMTSASDIDSHADSISENSTGPVGITAHVTVANGSMDPVTYSLASDMTGATSTSDPFAIDPTTGVVSLVRAFDYEADSSPHTKTIFVKATAADGSSAVQSFQVALADVYEKPTDVGGAGDDVLTGGRYADILKGYGGNDRLYGAGGGDTLFGGTGNDRLDGGAGGNMLRGEAGDDFLFGGPGHGALIGGSGNDKLIGGAARDVLEGEAGNDTIIAGGGNDYIVGGIGRDMMTGGSGEDDFRFTLKELGKTPTTRDVITDFRINQDDINLDGASEFTFVFLAIKGAAFTGGKRQIHWFQIDKAGTANDKTIVEGDIYGDKKADFQIELTGLKALTAGDFVL